MPKSNEIPSPFRVGNKVRWLTPEEGNMINARLDWLYPNMVGRIVTIAYHHCVGNDYISGYDWHKNGPMIKGLILWRAIDEKHKQRLMSCSDGMRRAFYYPWRSMEIIDG